MRYVIDNLNKPFQVLSSKENVGFSYHYGNELA